MRDALITQLDVALCIVIWDNKILLQKKIKSDYAGCWGFPSGKIKEGESPEQAAVRELREESGLESECIDVLGKVTERLTRKDGSKIMFLAHMCMLKLRTYEITQEPEGKLQWIKLNKLGVYRKEMIGSDYEMITRIVLENMHADALSEVHQEKEEYVLDKFETIGSRSAAKVF